ncbi:MAG: TIGR04283 family arsenosugar biosynthesis glycosyltransferase [Woeseiaceae bacterium]
MTRDDSPPLLVSIIIPVSNDNVALAALLARLTAPEFNRHATEIIVAAAVPDAQTRALTEAAGATLIDTPLGRGQQQNLGADAANGDIYWFLHADAMPPDNSLDIIRCATNDGQLGGWFRFEFDRTSSVAKRALAGLINWRAKHGVAYGDQALFFTRQAFIDHGGFANAPLFEESRLVRSCKQTGRFAAVDATTIVDSRRWERDGWWKRTLSNRALALAHLAGVPAEKLAAWYTRRR